jgi:hypothetical protein
LPPDIDLKNCTLAPFSSRSFHQEHPNSRSSAPFTVTATFADNSSIIFKLDGCDAENLARDREVMSMRGPPNYSVFQMTSHASEVGANNDWNKMTLFITPKVSPSGWMGRLAKRKPDITLPEITIPGTHESGTAGGNTEMGTRCQNLTIEDQLNFGVRFFDLRVRPYEDEKDLGIFHNRYTQNLWLGKQVLPWIKTFLENNPDECVILLFNRAVDKDSNDINAAKDPSY